MTYRFSARSKKTGRRIVIEGDVSVSDREKRIWKAWAAGRIDAVSVRVLLSSGSSPGDSRGGTP